MGADRILNLFYTPNVKGNQGSDKGLPKIGYTPVVGGG